MGNNGAARVCFGVRSLEAEDDGGAAGAGVRAGAAEHPCLLEHDGLAAELLGPWQPDAPRHLDHQSGSALGQRRPGAQVSSVALESSIMLGVIAMGLRGEPKLSGLMKR